MDDYSVQMINAHLTKQYGVEKSQVWAEFAVTRDCIEFTAVIWLPSGEKHRSSIFIPTVAVAKLSFDDIALIIYYNRRAL